LFGEFDLIAKIDAEDFEELGEIVFKKIRSIKGVIDTKTLTGVQSLK
jgi:DNA-binding Lrp family transcriptional regulator